MRHAPAVAALPRDWLRGRTRSRRCPPDRAAGRCPTRTSKRASSSARCRSSASTRCSSSPPARRRAALSRSAASRACPSACAAAVASAVNPSSPSDASASSAASDVAPRDEVVDASPVLLLQARQLGQATLDRFQPRRIGRQRAAVATELRTRVLELRQRLLDQCAHRLEAGVETLGLAQRCERPPEHVHRRRLARVHAALGAPDEVPEPLGVRQPRALARELRVLARHQRGLLELVELEAQQVAAVARDTLRGLPLLERRPRARERVPARAHRADVRLRGHRRHRAGRDGSPRDAAPDARPVRRHAGGAAPGRAGSRASRARRSRMPACVRPVRSPVGRAARPSPPAATPAARSASPTSADTSSKSASTTASSAPARTRSASGRPPSATSSAWSRIDLPAPVSPVTTLKPGSSTSSIESMMARSETRSARSTTSSFLAAPAQLRAQHVVVRAVGRPHQRHRRGRAPHDENVAAVRAACPPGRRR